MGLLLGVARGSVEPPRVIAMRTSRRAHRSPVLGLVGKGITFDTGGISIKPADGMERMKDDMAGGAAVVCAMRAIALLGAPIRVIGVVPMTENMPGGTGAQAGRRPDGRERQDGRGHQHRCRRPPDPRRRPLVRARAGRDAPRRRRHADRRLHGGARARSRRASSASPTSGSTPCDRTAERAGDRCWPMPLYDEYAEQLRSEIADMMNSGGRAGRRLHGGDVPEEFAGGLPWAHLDIAGTAWADEAKPCQPKGATGVAVRTLAELAFTCRAGGAGGLQD